MSHRTLGLFCALLAASAPALAAPDQAEQPFNLLAIGMFGLFVLATLGITWWAARRTRSTADFYTAGGGITGFQNGLAIAGDYCSAAALLGISSMVYAKGFDGLIYILCYFAAWPVFLFLMAERLRNLGRFTFADITAFRLDPKKIRLVSAINSLIVVCFYLIVQMVGAGELVRLLFGLRYEVAVMLVGCLMIVYVIFGGMIATTWVQIVKAVLLLSGGTVLSLMALSHFGFSLYEMTDQAVQVHKEGVKIMAPGAFLSDPVTVISLSLGLVFGTMGLPHILMRFFTVSNAKEARKSVFYATGFIGFFFILTAIIGLAGIVLVGTKPEFFEGGDLAAKLIGGNNMVALHLSKALGGDLFLGFLSAVTFATIIAVVAGLALAGASAISHDIYAQIIKEGNSSETKELQVSKMATIGIGVVSVILGIMFQKHNLTFLVGIAFGIAASCNFPVLLLSMYWRGLTTRGALWGSIAGLVSAVTIVVCSKAVWVNVIGNPTPLFPYEQPAIFSMPLAFLVIWIVSSLDRSTQADSEKAAFPSQEVRAQTGVGAAGAVAH